MLIRALLFFVGRWICQYFFTLIPNSLKILLWLKWTPSLSPTHFLKLKKLKGSVYNDCCVLHRVKRSQLYYDSVQYCTRRHILSHTQEHSKNIRTRQSCLPRKDVTIGNSFTRVKLLRRTFTRILLLNACLTVYFIS